MSSLVLRLQKESTLSYQELDGNFLSLDERSANSYTFAAGGLLAFIEGTFDFGNNTIKYANIVDEESDLQNISASTYHGMTITVSNTGALYYAYAGEWRKLLTDTTYDNISSEGYTDSLAPIAYTGNIIASEKTVETDTYTLEKEDENGIIFFTSDNAVTVTIPTNAAVSFAQRSTIVLVQAGDGVVEVEGVSGSVIIQGGPFSLTKEHPLTLYRKETDNNWFVLNGQVAA